MVQTGNCWVRVRISGIRSLNVRVAHLPDSYQHADCFVAEYLQTRAIAPPVMGVVLGIASGNDTQNCAWRKLSRADVPGSAGVIIRRDQKYALPTSRGDELTDRDAFLPRVLRVMSEPNNRSGGNAAIGEVMLFQFGDGGIRAQVSATCNDPRSESGLEEFRRPRGAVAKIVVISQDYDCVGILGSFVHNPKTACQTQQRMAY